MGRVMPQQMISPTTRLAERIGVRPTEKVRLNIHVLNCKIARLHATVNPLVARVEPSGVAAHRDQARALLRLNDASAVGEVVAHRDLHLDVLASIEAGDCLSGMHRCGRGKHDGMHLIQRQALGQIRRDMADVVLIGDLLGPFGRSVHDRHDSYIVDRAYGIEVFDPEGTSSGERNVDGHGVSAPDSARMRWPTAVLLAGT